MEVDHIIIDNGSGYIKAGISGEKKPSIVIPSYIGYPKLSNDKKEYFIGPEVEKIKDKLKYNYPIEQGEIKNWDEMEKIWRYIFSKELKIEPEEYKVMITEVPLNPIKHRGKIGEIMFETFNMQGLYIVYSSLLSLYKEGKLNGIVVDSGDGVTQIIPIYNGISINSGLTRIDFGGRDLTEYMIRLLIETGNYFSSSYEKEIAKDIKEKACYTALDYYKEIKKIKPFDYKLPDGKNITLTEQRIKCVEALFNPELAGKDIDNIVQSCFNSIEKCKKDEKKELYNNIVLSGGCSLFDKFPERFTNEIKELVSDDMIDEIKVIASPDRYLSAWKGGSVLSSLSTFQKNWITKSEYEEKGVSIFHT